MTHLPSSPTVEKKPRLRDFAYFVMMRAIWRYIAGQRRQYVIALVLMSGALLVWLLEPYFMGQIFNVIQDGVTKPGNAHKIMVLLLCYLMLSPISWLMHGPGRVMERKSGFFARQNFVQDMYNKLQQIPYAWHQNFHSGQLFDRIRKAESAIENIASEQFRYMGMIINFVGSAVALTLLFPWFGIACIVFFSVTLVFILRFDKHLVPLYKETNKLSHDYAGVFSDYMSNIRTIITLRLGEPTQNELLHRYQLKKKPEWKSYALNEWKWATIEKASSILTTGVIAVAIWGIYTGSKLFKVGNLVMLVQYIGKFANVFFNMGWMYQEITRAAADYKSTAIIDKAYDTYVTVDSLQKNNDIAAWKKIEIENLSFAYQDAEHRPHAIRNLSFDLARGEKIALVGFSGSGKSTLMTLLRGLYTAAAGHIVVDGVDYPLGALAQLTTLIPQDPEIFENTIRYNITFGVEHSDDEIMDSCRIAGFDTVLAQLPQGLESDIREKGVNLSGGQKQRLALARGVFAIQNSSLILLDEPTSSVDTLTELRIFERLFSEFADKTIMASVHRLHLLPRFDRVIVMEGGVIVEEGVFNDLLRSDGILAKIWKEYQAEQAKDAHHDHSESMGG
jgi:ABC-type multidrug transport system fused ATPase/permease subunit